jgi:hypothetical protein
MSYLRRLRAIQTVKLLGDTRPGFRRNPVQCIAAPVSS